MQTKTKQFQITRTIMDGQEVLGTVWNKKKYYFLADLKKLYGKKFMAYLPTNPISLRIAVSGNSQTRQLVNVSDFKDSFRRYKQETKAKVGAPSSIQKPKKVIAAQLEMCFDKSISEKQNKTTPSPANTSTDTDVAFRWKTVRANINRVIESYSKKHIDTEGVPHHALESTLKQAIIKNYTKAYNQFDESLAISNGITLDGLSSHGLGRQHRGKGVKYLDIIQNKGLLDFLEEVVNHLFKN